MPEITRLLFPQLVLSTRNAHHLRGYFGRLFQEKSPLLHNHLDNGELRYGYPLVQYKVLDGTPALIGINEGAMLLRELFLQIKELDIEGQLYPLSHKGLECVEADAGYSEKLLKYRFITLWMALNQNNCAEYVRLSPLMKQEKLQNLLRAHILAAFKGMGVWLKPEQRILVQAELTEKVTLFKNNKMFAFEGEFTTNAVLPKWIGVGKAVSRGFGAVELTPFI